MVRATSGEPMATFFLVALMLTLPSVLIRYVIRKEKQLKGILQDFCVGLTFALLLSCRLTYLVCALNLLIGMDAVFYHCFGYRLEWYFWTFIKSYRKFVDSAQEVKFLRYSLFFAAFLAFPLLMPKPPFLLSLGGVTLAVWALTLAFLKTHKPSTCHLYFYHLQKIRKCKNQSLSFTELSQLFSLQNEACDVLDPSYPLYRKTTGFKGKKQCNITLKPGEKPHIIMLFLESFRAKDVGETVTPHFHRLAQEGIFFSEFYSQSALTTRAMIASLFGVPHTLERDDYLNADLPLRGLPDLLKENGYQTHAFSGCSHLFRGEEKFYASHGFDDQIDCRTLRKRYPKAEGSHWGTKDEYLIETCVKHLEKQRETPQFYSIATITNHHPWILPPSFPTLNLSPSSNAFYDRYLQTMHYTDHCIGLLLERLREKKLANQTLVIIQGDHGLSFKGDDKNPLKFGSASKDLLHVPLLLYYEDHMAQPQTISTPGCQYDLLPTIMDLLHLQGEHHSIGQSLLRQQPKRNLYFFYPFIDTSIGLYDGEQKGSYIPETDEFYVYNWENDSDEKKPLTTRWLGGKKAAKKFPQVLHQLYKEKRFVPPTTQEKNCPLQIQLLPSSSRESLFTFFNGSKKIKSLDLSQHKEIDDEMLCHISQNHPEIECIFLDNCFKITDKGLEGFLKNCKGLQEIDLSNCMLLTSKTLFNLAKYDQPLVSLCASNTDVLVDLKHLPPLTTLRGLVIESLPGEKKDDVHFKRVFPNLFNLQISYLHLGVERLKKLLEPLMLYRLGLTNCETLEDEDLKALFARSSSWLCLFLLHLYRCHRITDKSIEFLCQLPLETLSLLECPNITPSGIQRLEKAIENLKVVAAQGKASLPFLEMDKCV